LAGPAHEALKEVALVNSNKLWKTAQTPSRFVMPISGHAFGAAVRGTDACTTATLVVRERGTGIAIGTKGVAKADMGLAQSYFPGSSAWRPPTC
jgi:hypothetical protein